MSLEERWDFVELKNLKGTPWQLQESTAVLTQQPMLAGGHAVFLPIVPEARGEPLKRKLYVLRDDVVRLRATDGCTACTDLISGNHL